MGEQGPELIGLSRGAEVIPAGALRGSAPAVYWPNDDTPARSEFARLPIGVVSECAEVARAAGPAAANARLQELLAISAAPQAYVPTRTDDQARQDRFQVEKPMQLSPDFSDIPRRRLRDYFLKQRPVDQLPWGWGPDAA